MTTSLAAPGRPSAASPVAFAALVAIPVIALTAPPAAAQVQPEGPEVVSIDFEGNETFSDRALRTAIATRQTECRSFVFTPFCWAGADWAQDPFTLDQRTVVRDMARVQLYYYQRGFREARVDTAIARPSADQAEVTFRVTEGRPVLVDSLALFGLESLPDTVDVVDELPLRVGDRLSGIALDATRDTLQTRLRNRGYAHAEVLRSFFIPTETPYGAFVSYDVYTGPRARFGPMEVVGNEVVTSDVVRRMLPFSEGEPYRRDLIFEAQRNLYNLDIFTYAEIRPDLGNDPDSIVPLRVQVNEGDVHRVRTGGGWNNADCVNLEARWTSRNFRGGARRLQARGRISNILAPTFNNSFCNQSGDGEFGELAGLVAMDFTQPWIWSPRNSLSLGLFAERQSLKDIYVRQSVGATSTLSRTVGPRQTFSVSFTPELSTLTAAEIYFCISFLVCSEDDIDVLASANWLSALTLSYSHDRSNRLLNPTDGYTYRIELEHASQVTGSDYSYNRVLGEITRYLPVADGVTLAGRIRGGWTKPLAFGEALSEADDIAIVHPSKRFFAGGSNSVRGYPQNQLGPLSLLVDVDVLLGAATDGEAACTPEEVQSLECDAATGDLVDEDGDLIERPFNPRPTGGSQLLEGNVELRMPFIGDDTEAVVFLDYGYVWPSSGDFALNDLKFTPGVGIRYYTPIGPIRVDLGYQVEAGAQRRVVTNQIRPYDPDADDPGDQIGYTNENPGNAIPWVATDNLAILQPTVLWDDSDPWSLSRFQLQFSLGQAF